MFDWRVLDGEPLPEEQPDPPSRRRGRGLTLVLLALVVGLIAGGVWRLVLSREARLEADLARAVADEELALRSGEAHPELTADPAAPRAWLRAYARSFGPLEQPLAEPRLTGVDFRDGVAITLLDYAGERPWAAARAYRLVDDGWRRTPLPPERWGPFERHDSARHTLFASTHDASLLPPAELLAFLETFRDEFAALWPVDERTRLTVTLAALDGEPILALEPAPGEREIVVTSPLLVEPAILDAYGGVEPARVYRYELATAVAAALDAGAGARDDPESELRRAMRRAVVRALLWDEDERRGYRAALRRGDGAIDEELRRAQVADYLLASEGPDAPARLLRAYHARGSLQTAAELLFGRSFTRIASEAALWGRVDALPRAPALGERHVATVLWSLGESPLRLMTTIDGRAAPVELRLTTNESFRYPPGCLGAGSLISFVSDSAERQVVVGRELAIERLRPPLWIVPPMPEIARLLVLRPAFRGGEQLLALDARGDPANLLLLPEPRALHLDPTGTELAFLLEDTCGTTINRYALEEGTLDRTVIAPEGSAHLFWHEGSLYLLDDVANGRRREWRLARVDERGLTWLGPLRVGPDDVWRGWRGYHPHWRETVVEVGEGRPMLLELESWIAGRDPDYRDGAALGIPEGATLVPTPRESRTIVYAVIKADGSTELFAIDLVAGYHTRAFRLEPGERLVEATTGPTPPAPLLAVVRRAGSRTDSLLLYTMEAVRRPTVRRIESAGRVGSLVWCDDERIFYTLDRGDGARLVEGLERPRQVTRDARLLACLTR